ncbi:hypothetical protein [Azospirillum sp. sgz302134]
MSRFITLILPAAALAGFVAGCTPTYSPNTYAASAAQQANKVERAVVIGFRQVHISTNGTVGAVTGGAAGGVLGSQSGAFGLNSALGAVGGTALGGLIGTSIEHVTGDTDGWEYIVRKPDGELLSVTQKEERPLAVGQKVLVISGNQARIVADYSLATDPEPPKEPAKEKAKAEEKPKPETAKADEKKPDDNKLNDNKPDETVEAKDVPAPEPAPAPAPPPTPEAAPAQPPDAPSNAPLPEPPAPPPASPTADAAQSPAPSPAKPLSLLPAEGERTAPQAAGPAT